MKQRRLMNQINVVPYVDVMLVLLVIFMVTAPMMQTGSINLPSVGKAAQPPVAPLEVIVHANGSLALRDRAHGSAEQSVSDRDLPARLKQAQTKNPQQAVLIAGDKSVRYEAILNVMDALQKNQVTKIGLLVQPVNSAAERQ
jgi:biopolymer transport protein TolR